MPPELTSLLDQPTFDKARAYQLDKNLFGLVRDLCKQMELMVGGVVLSELGFPLGLCPPGGAGVRSHSPGLEAGLPRDCLSGTGVRVRGEGGGWTVSGDSSVLVAALSEHGVCGAVGGVLCPVWPALECLLHLCPGGSPRLQQAGGGLV